MKEIDYGSVDVDKTGPILTVVWNNKVSISLLGGQWYTTDLSDQSYISLIKRSLKREWKIRQQYSNEIVHHNGY